MSRFNSLKLVLTGLFFTAAMVSGLAHAKSPMPADLQATISLTELPAKGVEMYARIHQGGPFLNEKDGVMFGNREHLLPNNKRGFYREYTVLTPGVTHRGVKRIVCGGPPKTPDICYYTADHYASFRRIVP